MRVIVVGAGPAGLAAAHAAAALGAKVRIIAPRQKTPQRGPLLIQRPIPAINTTHPDGTIHQLVIGGSILDYRLKLYGDINIGINGNILQPSYHAWRHQETYDLLWLMYSGWIEDRMVERDEMADLSEQPGVLVVSTANARTMCMKPNVHNFISAKVAITPEAEFVGQPYNTIIFNAGDKDEWVRSSNIFGNTVTEWPAYPGALTRSGCRIIEKPISTDCDCYPRVLRTGRFGAFKNEVWVDTAYWDTYTAIESMGRPELRSIV
jgi:Pyridine nucleotide-disulphide oxidoreductase